MGTSRFCKNPNFAEPYNTVFLYFITTFAKSDNTWGFGGVRAQKLSKKYHFMDAESVRKTLEILTNHKCYTDVTYHDYVPSWGDQFCKKLGCNSIRRIRNLLKWNRKPLRHVLPCIASLVKTLYKQDLIWGSNPWKSTQNGLKRTASGVLLSFEGL